MELYPPQVLNEIGERGNNEDAVYPIRHEANEKDRLFMVCDGVGGQSKGEIASELLCKCFSDYVRNYSKDNISKSTFDQALISSEDAIDIYMNKYPESNGMASTLTYIYFDEINETAHIGWLGDSRIYHVRNGNILFKSKDHSVVQSLIDMAEITVEEAKTDPRRNMILRAVNGKKIHKMDYRTIIDIQLGDYFLLCTDGILENLDEKFIEAYFLKESSITYVKDILLKNAIGRTKDNFSMYLLKIRKI